jgi:hypothetical protein
MQRGSAPGHFGARSVPRRDDEGGGEEDGHAAGGQHGELEAVLRAASGGGSTRTNCVTPAAPSAGMSSGATSVTARATSSPAGS